MTSPPHLTTASLHGHRPIRVMPIPDSGAPTISLSDVHLADPEQHDTSLVLDLEFTPDRPPPVSVQPRRRRPDPPEGDFGPVPTSTVHLPEVSDWAARLAVALVEVARGGRSAMQVTRWLTPEVFDSMVRRQSRAIRRGRATRRPVGVRGTRVCHLQDGVVEASVAVQDGPRVRAIGLRLEGRDRRWVVTALDMG